PGRLAGGETMTTASDRVVEALARLSRHSEERPEPSRTPPLSIALSRQAGSRGAEIARAVGERLGWPVYDHELLERIAPAKGLHQHLLEKLDERYISWLEEVIAGFNTHSTIREYGYITHLVQQFASLSKVGHCILVGRGAPHVLPAETTFRVRVIAPLKNRV